MAKFALPIKSTYVPDWGVWECVREFVQNAKDEEQDRGHEMKISHRGEKLRITNVGADMDRSVLLLGKTTKADRGDLRGQFGEGLNLAILAGVREGFSIVIYTQTERWSASIEACAEFGNEECLVIQSRKLPNRRTGVEVEITGISKDAWETLRDDFFTFLAKIPDNRIVRVEGKGSVLLEEKRKGCIYSKGVFVSRMDRFDHGYDLDNLALDRDRRMVDVWDLQYTLGAIFEQAVAKRPELLKADVYRMLRDGSEDTKHMHFHVGRAVGEAIVDAFAEEHGAEAVAVGSIQESQQVDRVGKKGVVVSESLKAILQARLGKPEDIVQEALRGISATYAWTDLCDAEQAVLSAAAEALDEVLPEDRDAVLARVEIVSFRDDNLGGTCDLASGKIRVARRCLTNLPKCLLVLVHEEAHAITSAGDGTDSHQAAIENLWMLLWAAKGAS
jgi:hypothetical protein